MQSHGHIDPSVLTIFAPNLKLEASFRGSFENLQVSHLILSFLSRVFVCETVHVYFVDAAKAILHK